MIQGSRIRFLNETLNNRVKLWGGGGGRRGGRKDRISKKTLVLEKSEVGRNLSSRGSGVIDLDDHPTQIECIGRRSKSAHALVWYQPVEELFQLQSRLHFEFSSTRACGKRFASLQRRLGI